MIKLFIFFAVFTAQINYSQTLDQQLRQAQNQGVITPEISTQLTNNTNVSGLAVLNQSQFFKDAPGGISSLFVTPELIEEVRMGNLTVYFPKGYGSNVLHYGIWNAIPFVVFDNNSLELRFGLIFEHRQVGFVPDDWVSTSITGSNLPEISFLIPKSKTFLSFTHGSSQWRSTVLLTEKQIQDLSLYAQENNNLDPQANIFTVNHRFTDSSARPYLIGLRHKSFFQMMLQIYNHISGMPLVKKFRSSDAFPAGAFFEELTIENVVTEETQIQSEIIEEIVDLPQMETGEDDGYEEYEDGDYEDGDYEDYEDGDYEETE
ncbi:MAG: hypothetical protein ACRCWI_00275 [Brevinema sp.]